MKGDDRQGQTLAEFALVLPIVILLLAAVVDIGRAVYAWNTVGNAARVGARVAVVNQVESSPECANDRPVVDAADPHWSIAACAVAASTALAVTQDDVTVTYAVPPGSGLTCTAGDLDVGCIARVTVAYDYTALTPIVGGVIGSFRIEASSEMPIERVFP